MQIENKNLKSMLLVIGIRRSIRLTMKPARWDSHAGLDAMPHSNYRRHYTRNSPAVDVIQDIPIALLDFPLS